MLLYWVEVRVLLGYVLETHVGPPISLTVGRRVQEMLVVAKGPLRFAGAREAHGANRKSRRYKRNTSFRTGSNRVAAGAKRKSLRYPSEMRVFKPARTEWKPVLNVSLNKVKAKYKFSNRFEPR